LHWWVVVRGCSEEQWPLWQWRSSNCSTTSPLISQQTANDDDDIATGNSGIAAVVLVETADRSSWKECYDNFSHAQPCQLAAGVVIPPHSWPTQLSCRPSAPNRTLLLTTSHTVATTCTTPKILLKWKYQLHGATQRRWQFAIFKNKLKVEFFSI
jgi:hypothetical protein